MTTNIQIREKPMHARQATMDDGRYIIYYTFDEGAEEKSAGREKAATAEEESNV